MILRKAQVNKLLYDFNIRDTIVFTLNPIFFKSEKLNEKQHFLVVT